jgi:hypothetical protein
MWIKTIQETSSRPHLRLVNLANASEIGVRRQGPLFPWEIVVRHSDFSTTVATFDNEQQLEETTEKISAKLNAVYIMDL